MSKDKPFNSGLSGLAKIKEKMKEQPPQAEPKKAALPLAPPKRGLSEPAQDDGAEAFLRAMQGVERMAPDVRGERQRPVETRSLPVVEHEDDALIDLAATLDPEKELVSDDPLKAGWAHSLDKRIMRKLKGGDIPFAAVLDLHGRRKEQAERDLERFLHDALRSKHRCVLVVTGKGVHSEVPVLKPAIVDALRRGKLVRHVLAYAEAQARDGGEGAYYVLLRRR